MAVGWVRSSMAILSDLGVSQVSQELRLSRIPWRNLPPSWDRGGASIPGAK